VLGHAELEDALARGHVPHEGLVRVRVRVRVRVWGRGRGRGREG
jgi:hypothetical protein